MEKLEKLWKLFIVTFSVSSTTSGGHAITAVLKPIFIEKYHWLDEDELLDLVAIGQATPGSIAVNVSVILGYRVAGFAGAIAAMMGTIIPPFAIMLLVTIFYDWIAANEYISYFMSGMQAGVAALIGYVTYENFILNKKTCSIFGYALMIISFVYVMFTSFSIAYLVLGILVAIIIRTKFITRSF